MLRCLDKNTNVTDLIQFVITKHKILLSYIIIKSFNIVVILIYLFANFKETQIEQPKAPKF